jgi:hypothetical protein
MTARLNDDRGSDYERDFEHLIYGPILHLKRNSL